VVKNIRTDFFPVIFTLNIFFCVLTSGLFQEKKVVYLWRKEKEKQMGKPGKGRHHFFCPGQKAACLASQAGQEKACCTTQVVIRQ